LRSENKRRFSNTTAHRARRWSQIFLGDHGTIAFEFTSLEHLSVERSDQRKDWHIRGKANQMPEMLAL